MTSHACFRAVSDVRAASSLVELHDIVTQITRDFGFDNFAIIKRDPSNLYVEPSILSDLPSIGRGHCSFGRGTYALIHEAEASLTPFWWTTRPRLLPDGQPTKLLEPELCPAELGLVIPVPDSDDVGAGGLVAFALMNDTGETIQLPPFSMQIGFHAFHQAARLWRVNNETPQITNLQRDLIVHLAHGRPYPVIAQMLDRKTGQISTEVTQLRQRYRVRSREQIVMHALKERAVKLIDLIAT